MSWKLLSVDMKSEQSKQIFEEKGRKLNAPGVYHRTCSKVKLCLFKTLHILSFAMGKNLFVYLAK